MDHKFAKPQIHRYSLTAVFILFIFLFQSLSSFAQQNYSEDKKAQKKYDEAQVLYKQRDLKSATTILNEALERDPKFVQAHTLLAYIYLDLGDYSQAKQKFKDAQEANPTAIPNNLFFLGELELKQGNFSEGKKYLTQFLASNPQDESLRNRSLRGIDRAEYALELQAHPVPFDPVNLGPDINSVHAEYFPCLTVDESIILFTRRLPFPDSPQGYNEDFFVARKDQNDGWKLAKNLGQPINTSFNEGAPSLAADGQLLFFTACELYGDYGAQREGRGSCDLFYTYKKGDNWGRPRNLGNPINSPHWETQPSFSADGKTLYFVRGKRSRSGSRTGDIYVTEIGQDGYWTEPKPLGPVINTKGNEESVFIHPDGKTLYFASDGHLGMGGLDLFKSVLGPDGIWSEPKNLGYPINTFQNENSLLVSANGKEAYFASDREGGYGDLDLYKFDLPADLQPTPVTYFAGKIVDRDTKAPLDAKFELIDLATEQLIVESYADASDGSFLVSLPMGRDYALNASKDGYLFYSENFSLSREIQNTPKRKNIEMQAIQVGEAIVLKNIFFETNSFSLEKESIAELTKLLEFLEANPKVKIEISGHTDSVGQETANQVLSQNRAEAVQKFLLEKNVPVARLIAKGYGSKKPISSNDTEDGRSQNRRTEFKIISM